jgi:hypothetical protein
MDRERFPIGGAKKDPFYHCCQRGRKLINNKNISKKRLPSKPKWENVGHSDMILSLISTECR